MQTFQQHPSKVIAMSKEIKNYALASAVIHSKTKYLLSVLQTKQMLNELNIDHELAHTVTQTDLELFWINKISKYQEFIGLDFANSFDIRKYNRDESDSRSHELQSLISEVVRSPMVCRVLSADEVDEGNDGYYCGEESIFVKGVECKNDAGELTAYADALRQTYTITTELYMTANKNIVVVNDIEKVKAMILFEYLNENIGQMFYSATKGDVNRYLVEMTKSDYSEICEIYNHEQNRVLGNVRHYLAYVKDGIYYVFMLTCKEFGKLKNSLKKVSSTGKDFNVELIMTHKYRSIAMFGSFYGQTPFSGQDTAIADKVVQKRNGQWKTIGSALKEAIDRRTFSQTGFTEFEKIEINRTLGEELTADEAKAFEERLNKTNGVVHNTFDLHVEMTKGDDYLTVVIDDTCLDTTFTIHHNLPLELDKNPPWLSYESVIVEVISQVFRWSLMTKNKRPIYLVIRTMNESLPGGHFVIKTTDYEVGAHSGLYIDAKFYCINKRFEWMKNRIPEIIAPSELALNIMSFSPNDQASDVDQKTITVSSKILARKINLFSFNTYTGALTNNGLSSNYLITPHYTYKDEPATSDEFAYALGNGDICEKMGSRIVEICLDTPKPNVMAKICPSWM